MDSIVASAFIGFVFGIMVAVTVSMALDEQYKKGVEDTKAMYSIEEVQDDDISDQ